MIGEKTMTSNDIYDVKLEELRKLHPNWDGYDGMPPSEEALNAAKNFMDSLFIVPAPDGSVQLEWHAEGIDLEICFNVDGLTKDFSFNYSHIYSYKNPSLEYHRVGSYNNADVYLTEMELEDVFTGIDIDFFKE